MSVDARLRQARPEHAAPNSAGLDAVQVAIVREARARRRRRRWTAAALGAVAAALVVGGIVQVTGPRDREVAPAPAPPPPSERVAPTTLDGRWSTPALTRAAVVERLVGHGVAPATAEAYVRMLPRGTFTIRLLVANGILQSYTGDWPMFRQGLELGADTLTMTTPANGTGTWTLGWRIASGQLTFVLRGTDVAPYDGFPADVHALAAFCVAPFTRTD